MGKIYARKIMETIDGSYTIKSVPKMWYAKTIQAFKDFVNDSTITKDEYTMYTELPYQ